MAIDKAITYLKKNAPKGEFLAYINPKEAAMLKKAGGSGKKVNGIPSFRPQDMGNKANQKRSAASTGSTSRRSSTRNTNKAGTQNTGNAREDYISNYVSKGIVKGGGTKKADGTYHDATVSGDRGRSSAREWEQQLNQDNARRAAQTGQKFTPYKGGARMSSTYRGGGINDLFRALIGMAIPGAGFLMGGYDKLKGGLGSLNEALGDFREKRTGFRTQQEWEDARTQRQLQGRLDDMYAAKSKGKGFSQKNIDMIEAMGFSPSTAQNVLTGRDLKGFTPSRMGLQTIDKPTQTFSFDNSGITRNDLPSNNYVADALTTPTGGDYGFSLIELDRIKKGGYDPGEVSNWENKEDVQSLIKSLEPSGYTDADFTNKYGYPMTAGLLSNIGVRPTMGIKNTPLGPVPTGDVGLNTSGRLGNLSATVDAIDALKGKSVNPALNYSGTFDNTLLGGQTNVFGNYSDDAQNIGLNFNNDKGLSGGISYDAITGEPRFDIGFRRTFADGGLASMFTRRG